MTIVADPHVLIDKLFALTYDNYTCTLCIILILGSSFVA